MYWGEEWRSGADWTARKTGIKLVKIKFALQRGGERRGGEAVVVSSINCSINKRVDAALFFGVPRCTRKPLHRFRAEGGRGEEEWDCSVTSVKKNKKKIERKKKHIDYIGEYLQNVATLVPSLDENSALR